MTRDLHDLAAAYALDAVDAVERRRFEDHLQDCDACTTEVREFRAAALELAAAVDAPLPTALRERVLAGVAVIPQEPPGVPAVAHRRSLRFLPLLAAAVVMAVVLAAGLGVRDLAAERDRAQALAAVLAAPDARHVSLQGIENSTVRVVWSPTADGTVVVGANVPEPGAGRVYELWALTAGGPRSVGVFEPQQDGRIERRLPLPVEPSEGWRVTVEPLGGSPQPSADVAYEGA